MIARTHYLNVILQNLHFSVAELLLYFCCINTSDRTVQDMIKLFLKLTVPAVAVLAGAHLLPGVEVRSFSYAILVAVILGFLNGFVKPILQILTIPITILTMGIFLIVLDALMILLVDSLLEGFSVSGILTAIIFSVIVSVITSIIYQLLDEKP